MFSLSVINTAMSTSSNKIRKKNFIIFDLYEGNQKSEYNTVQCTTNSWYFVVAVMYVGMVQFSWFLFSNFCIFSKKDFNFFIKFTIQWTWNLYFFFSVMHRYVGMIKLKHFCVTLYPWLSNSNGSMTSFKALLQNQTYYVIFRCVSISISGCVWVSRTLVNSKSGIPVHS